MLSLCYSDLAHMTVSSNGMTREPSISGSDSGPSTSSPVPRGSPNPRDSVHGGDARRHGDMDGDGHLGVEPADDGSQRRRGHRNRKSSDFLLDSGPSSSPSMRRFSHYQGSRQRDNEGAVGKGKRKNDELSVGKYRSPKKLHRQGLSLGSSPLVTMTSASAAEESPHSETDRSRLPGDAAPNEGLSPGATHFHQNDGPSSSPHHDAPPPSVGYDTDPAQIVNLALNLSESRRRHLPGRLPSRTMSGGRKRNTTAQAVSSHGDRHPQDLSEGSSADHGINAMSPVQEHTKRSSTGSPNIPGAIFPKSSPPPDGTRGHVNSKDKYVPLEFSDATILRAQKAKNHFELLYEYLRLLPHLPPLRRPPNKSSFASAAASSSLNSLPQSRVYNPLQYIRNRKMRFREKCPIDTESGGWHDVENVHNWVDAVARLNRESSDDPDEYLRLPPLNVEAENELSIEEKVDDNEIGSAASSLRRNNGNNSTKPRRPRMDWIVRPPDLLADSAWLEEGTNKSKIEDRDGNKIYPPGTDFKATGWQNVDSGLDSSSPQEEEIEPDGMLDYRETLPSVQSGTSRDTKSLDRGRRRHKISRSIHLPHSRSQSSKAGKSKWRRALSRSSSSSSASDIGSSRGRRKPGTDLNGIDAALLEKQMVELQEKGMGRQQDMKPREDDRTPSGRKSLRQLPKLPNLITAPLEQRSSSLPPDGVTPVSPALSVADKDRIGRMSLEDMDSTAPNSPSSTNPFPKITINLSPPVSRSSSPAKKPNHRITDERHDRSKVQQRNARSSLELTADNQTPDDGLTYTRSEADAVPSVTYPLFDGSPKPKTNLGPEVTPGDGLQRSDSSSMKGYRYPGSQESRLRGIFKGGRIAEIVGNEVSRVGDFIWKKDAPVTSQQSSSASSVASDNSDGEDEKPGGTSKGRPLAYFRRLPTFSEEGGRLSRKTTDPESSKFHVPSLPNFTSSLKQEDEPGEPRTHSQPASFVDHTVDRKHAMDDGGRASLDGSHKIPKIDTQSVSPSTADVRKETKDSPTVSKGYGFGLPLLAPDKNGRRRNRMKDSSARSVRNEKLPVTGLTNLEPSADVSQKRRPTLSRATRDWSISSRSITATSDTSLADKREIERVRALLLSSGIKAHEITRRAAEIRDPPDFLLRSRHCFKDPIPRVTRAEEYIYAARNIDYTLKRTIPSLQNSMNTFSKTTCPSLKSELDRLEKIISESLTQRTRTAASAAEDLSTELITTNTLAVKQLNDALDKGIRKRNRRLRWLRRVGFVLLEWALVGIMWWVWLVVMVWKIMRGLCRGTVSGVRWILWL